MGDVRRQVLAHLREKDTLSATLIRDAVPRACTVQHCLSDHSSEPYSFTAPLRLVFTDEEGGTRPYTWDEMYEHGYVRATPLHMLVFHNFDFKPKVLSAPSLGNRDASPVEICDALRALDGRSTPVIATVTDSDGTDRRRRLELRVRWEEEEDEEEEEEGDEEIAGAAPVSLELRSSPLRFSRQLEFRHLFVGVNTGSVVAHDLVRHIKRRRLSEPAAVQPSSQSSNT